MRVAITGASGLVGSALCTQFQACGVQAIRLVRREASAPDEVTWDPAGHRGAPAALEGVDAVVHLAGRRVMALRWTPRIREEIRASRVDGTRNLVAALAQQARPPRVLISASAVGYYGDRGDEVLTEASAPGSGFLAETAQAWEAAAQEASTAWGARVVRVRLGLVLSRAGGALSAMLPAFRLGLGGPLGSGRQYQSWITLSDVVGAIRFLLERQDATGAYNLVAPEPVPQRDFARALGTVLGRPARLPIPAPILRLALGEQARALLLASARAYPERLLAMGFRPRHDELHGALRHALGLPEFAVADA